MRILVFGDSITQGFWDSEGGWVARLRKYYDLRQLEDITHHDEPTVFNLGISGDNSAKILARIENEIKAREYPDQEFVVVVSTGINDSYRLGTDEFKMLPEEYEENLRQIVAISKKYAQKIMLVGLTPPDDTKTNPVFWKDAYFMSERVKLFENIMQRVSNEESIAFTAIFDSFKAKLDTGEDLLADGLHPNDQGHKFLANLIRPQIENLFVE